MCALTFPKLCRRCCTYKRKIIKLNDVHAVAIAMLNDMFLKVQQEAAALRRKAADKEKDFTTLVDRLNDEKV